MSDRERLEQETAIVKGMVAEDCERWADNAEANGKALLAAAYRQIAAALLATPEPAAASEAAFRAGWAAGLIACDCGDVAFCEWCAHHGPDSADKAWAAYVAATPEPPAEPGGEGRRPDAWVTERGFRNFTEHDDPYVTAYRKRSRGDVPVYFGTPPAEHPADEARRRGPLPPNWPGCKHCGNGILQEHSEGCPEACGNGTVADDEMGEQG